jgi:hypothetical protein
MRLTNLTRRVREFAQLLLFWLPWWKKKMVEEPLSVNLFFGGFHAKMQSVSEKRKGDDHQVGRKHIDTC